MKKIVKQPFNIKKFIKINNFMNNIEENIIISIKEENCIFRKNDNIETKKLKSAYVILNYGISFFYQYSKIDHFGKNNELLFFIVMIYLLGNEGERFQTIEIIEKSDLFNMNSIILNLIDLLDDKDHEIFKRIIEIDYLLNNNTKMQLCKKIYSVNDEYINSFLEFFNF